MKRISSVLCSILVFSLLINLISIPALAADNDAKLSEQQYTEYLLEKTGIKGKDVQIINLQSGELTRSVSREEKAFLYSEDLGIGMSKITIAVPYAVDDDGNLINAYVANSTDTLPFGYSQSDSYVTVYGEIVVVRDTISKAMFYPLGARCIVQSTNSNVNSLRNLDMYYRVYADKYSYPSQIPERENVLYELSGQRTTFNLNQINYTNTRSWPGNTMLYTRIYEHENYLNVTFNYNCNGSKYFGVTYNFKDRINY
ncbi:hypothetical protein [Murimonas intestini]|uniref:Uncharacterized protein n=1 Tax=Murimonas intestini TaxID=1337051 RepID=A0AB73T479_9FIRM|nr:hypothetical protein [Murimonas intestini]MCR1840956.1 hypothetical protein [Murimonas intestini]MCR1865926.1 hypothetical protein [Murimonas intestini]MCR1883346.1 hypothetical protein [Murimonas intestini]